MTADEGSQLVEASYASAMAVLVDEIDTVQQVIPRVWGAGTGSSADLIMWSAGSGKSNQVVFLAQARRHREEAHRIDRAGRFGRALAEAMEARRAVGPEFPAQDRPRFNGVPGLAPEWGVQGTLSGNEPSFGDARERAAQRLAAAHEALHDALTGMAREARAHEAWADLLENAVLLQLGVLSVLDEHGPFVHECSPCGLTRLRCAIVPRPPTAGASFRDPFELALAA
ncbi:hypothetical protein [Streptomyces sp. NPDC004435]|uniref:hypothetical protein n=1 Tax=Streptomyces sp. NPDC004435 TaxID=3364701 RepID=UPI0036740F5B